jgi:hypothetical protein
MIFIPWEEAQHAEFLKAFEGATISTNLQQEDEQPGVPFQICSKQLPH